MKSRKRINNVVRMQMQREQSNRGSAGTGNNGDTAMVDAEESNNVNGEGTTTLENNNNNSNDTNNNDVNPYLNFISSRSINVLLIGLSYNQDLLKQFLASSEIVSISQYTDSNGRIIDPCVARDTFRCYALEQMYSDVKVFTVNKCTDTLRLCDNDIDPFNISCDVGTHQFMKLIQNKSWKFHEIYLDTIQMPKIYLEHNFGNFFSIILLNYAT